MNCTGDRGGIADLEASIDIAAASTRVEFVRAYRNLASTWPSQATSHAIPSCTTKRLPFLSGSASRTTSVGCAPVMLDRWFWDGRWDEASRLADEFIAETEAGSPFYLESAWRTVRGRIRLGRGDLSGALEDSTKSIDLVQSGQDPQLRDPVFIFAANALIKAGRNAGGRRPRQRARYRQSRRRCLADLCVDRRPSGRLRTAWAR